jgi:UDP-N-acetylglucosamine 4,6-dehydratase
MKNEKIFITGGAGFLGKNLVRKYYGDNEITVYSRDESKHYYLKKKYPDIRCIVGDIRNYELLNESLKGHTVAIFAASLKQIEAVDQNVSEAEEIIIRGAINSRRAAIQNKLKAATFISTDKSRAPTTLYGSMKFVAGESFIINAEQESTLLSSVIYGNVLNSTGSIIPLIWDSIKRKYALTLYGEEMTRFMVEIDEAIQCIEYALKITGHNIVPNLRSFRVKDLFEIYSEKFGLVWTLGQPRISEKLNEQMIAPLERHRTRFDKQHNMYLMHYKDLNDTTTVPENGLSSENCLVSKEELEVALKAHNYFQPE